MRGCHLGITVDALARETLLLYLPGRADAFPYGGRRLGGLVARHFLPLQGGDLDMEVDAVQKRAGDFTEVFLYLVRRAGAFLRWVRIIATRTSLRCHSVVSN